jgi:hypothetical protein
MMKNILNPISRLPNNTTIQEVTIITRAGLLDDFNFNFDFDINL